MTAGATAIVSYPSIVDCTISLTACLNSGLCSLMIIQAFTALVAYGNGIDSTVIMDITEADRLSCKCGHGICARNIMMRPDTSFKVFKRSLYC